jgi:hypothetical protein
MSDRELGPPIEFGAPGGRPELLAPDPIADAGELGAISSG